MNGNGIEFLQGMPSTSAIAQYRLRILDATAVPTRNQPVSTVLMWPPARINVQIPRDAKVTSREASSVLRSSFFTLNDSLWLTDDIINYVAQSLIQPSALDIHCCNIYFFQKLLQETEINPWYDQIEVHNWSNRVEGWPSLFHLCEIHFPINKAGVHWFLLRVRPAKKTIELWDSTGCDEMNQYYLRLVCCHL